MDYGDINPVDPFNSLNLNKAHNQFMYQGQDIRPLNSGILHEYVQLYTLLGQTKKAAALGQKILDNYNSIIAYFEHSDVEIAGNEDNAEDLIAVALKKTKSMVLHLNARLKSLFKRYTKKCFHAFTVVWKCWQQKMARPATACIPTDWAIFKLTWVPWPNTTA
jgi:hypothetical protein